MKSGIMNQNTRIAILFLSIVFFITSVFPTYATQSVKELEDSTSGLESELSDLENELDDLEKELNDLIAQIEATTSDLESIRKDLAIAKGNEIAQYESMMTRIKYMYENGNSTILELLFSSKCLTEFINRAEFYSAINEYDRNLLAEYTANRESITANEEKLKEKQEYLYSLQKELAEKEKIIKNKISTTSTELEDSLAKLQKAKDAAEKAENDAKKEVQPILPEKPKEDPPSDKPPEIADNGAVSYTDKDVELLAALIECEAGSTNYEAMLAVGAVVVNRMKHSSYPNTLYGVIYQSGQFPPATNGKMDSILERGVKDSCVIAATDALNGKSNVEDCISFRAASSGRPGVIIGDNVFFF